MIENPAQAPSEQSLDTWKRTFDTNVYALVAVTQAFLPLVKQAKSGRIVNVSSMLGSQTLHADPSSGIYDFKIPAYNASKAAVNSWTLSLAYELRNTPIKVNTVHPGYVKTDMNGGNGEIEIAEGALQRADGADRRIRCQRQLHLPGRGAAMVIRTLAMAVSSLVLAGCVSVGPNYRHRCRNRWSCRAHSSRSSAAFRRWPAGGRSSMIRCWNSWCMAPCRTTWTSA